MEWYTCSFWPSSMQKVAVIREEYLGMKPSHQFRKLTSKYTEGTSKTSKRCRRCGVLLSILLGIMLRRQSCQRDCKGPVDKGAAGWVNGRGVDVEVLDASQFNEGVLGLASWISAAEVTEYEVVKLANISGPNFFTIHCRLPLPEQKGFDYDSPWSMGPFSLVLREQEWPIWVCPKLQKFVHYLRNGKKQLNMVLQTEEVTISSYSTVLTHRLEQHAETE